MLTTAFCATPSGLIRTRFAHYPGCAIATLGCESATPSGWPIGQEGGCRGADTSRSPRWYALLLAALGLLCATPCARATDKVVDSIMYRIPVLPRALEKREFPEGLKANWLEALARPESDSRCQAALSIALAHRLGMKDLQTTARGIAKALGGSVQDLTARLAIVRALIALDARQTASQLFEQAESSGPGLQALVDPALARWDYQPARRSGSNVSVNRNRQVPPYCRPSAPWLSSTRCGLPPPQRAGRGAVEPCPRSTGSRPSPRHAANFRLRERGAHPGCRCFRNRHRLPSCRSIAFSPTPRRRGGSAAGRAGTRLRTGGGGRRDLNGCLNWTPSLSFLSCTLP